MSQYRVPVLENFEHQQAILSAALSAPPGSPVKGDRYIVAASPTGAWSGKTNNIAWFDGAAWQFDVPTEGFNCRNLATHKDLEYNGTSWVDEDADEMHKATYDTTANGIVDKAETVDDGAGNVTTAAQVKTAYDRRGSYDSGLKAILFTLP